MDQKTTTLNQHLGTEISCKGIRFNISDRKQVLGMANISLGQTAKIPFMGNKIYIRIQQLTRNTRIFTLMEQN